MPVYKSFFISESLTAFLDGFYSITSPIPETTMRSCNSEFLAYVGLMGCTFASNFRFSRSSTLSMIIDFHVACKKYVYWFRRRLLQKKIWSSKLAFRHVVKHRVVNTRCCFGPTTISLSCVQNTIYTDNQQSNNLYNVTLDNVIVNVSLVVAWRKIVEGILGMMAWWHTTPLATSTRSINTGVLQYK